MVELLTAEAANALRRAPLTYSEVGATGHGLPAGYQHLRVSAHVGTGPAAFGAAAESLLTWGMHEGAGLTAHVSDLRIRPGTVAALRLGLGPLALRVPVRVLDVVQEERRRGFVYGTLPGHPERGEESFLVQLADDAAVHFDLVAFSRGARWFTVLGAPAARLGQRVITSRYIRAVRADAAATR